MSKIVEEKVEKLQPTDPNKDLSNEARHERLMNKVKEERKRESLNSFILNEDEIPQQLDHAVGSILIGDKSFRYYGSKMFEKIQKTTKGGQTYEAKQENPVLILEDGRVISEQTKPEGCNFQFESIMTLKNSRWELGSIKEFIFNKINKEDFTFKKVYFKFKNFHDDSMVYEHEEWYKLNAIWDVCTYYYDMIDKFLIIKHDGISGAAKSKGMRISANLSFNGKKFLCPNPANYFRYRHHNKGPIGIEEAERLFSNDKKNNAQDSELVEYLNGSYEKGNTVPRQNDKNINQTDEFDPAGFTRIGSIKPLKGALEKRSVPLLMIKANPGDKRGNVEIPTETHPAYKKARNMAYIVGLIRYREYKETLKTVKNNYKLSNREWLISKPILAMAHCIDEGLEKEIGKFLEKLFIIRDDSVDDSSWKMQLAKILLQVYCQHRDNEFKTTDSLKEILQERINAISDGKVWKISSNKLGNLMGELSLGNLKCRNTTGTKRGYRLDFFTICSILLRNELMTIEDIKNKVSEVSNCQYKDDKIMEWYSDTYLTNKKNKKVVSKSSDNLTDLTLHREGRGVTKWNKNLIIHRKCTIKECSKTECNEDAEGILYCKDHFEEMAL
jgi:hypothetical protein